VIVLGIALMGATLPACADVVVHSASNPSAHFERYRTFSFGPAEGPPDGYQSSELTPEVRRRLVPLIAAALTSRGYSAATDKGDFFIMFGAGRRTVSTPKLPVEREWRPDDESADFVQGSVVVDAFETSTGTKVWHAQSRTTISPDHLDEEALKDSVNALAASFPRATP
jgi:hypothetical protein